MKEKYLNNLSGLILKKMQEGNYTIARFADESGVSIRTINNVLSRTPSITFETVEKICDAHGFSLIDVFGLQEEFERKTIDNLIQNFVLTDGKSVYNIVSKK